ncbi:MAG: transporter substrate-binding domain-containing protein [Peptococcaceae bacterium]|jgi:branched-chain amino acid transport system substrate-binding protein/urea transport system substrate-binding protein|nr:transporter substrate-binding domain-containing protein [Peptococcaceae bacterium]
MKKSKRVLALLALLVMLASLTACGSSAANSGPASGGSGKTEGEKIKIGILFSSSGTTAGVEQAMINASKMAFDEINAQGGIAGHQVEYIHEDYASDPATATKKIQKLIQQDEVLATVGCYTSASRQATLPTLLEENSLLVYPTYTEGEEVHPNVIYIGAMPNQQATDYIPWLIENEGKTAFLVGSDYVFPKTCNKQAKILIEKFGGQVVGEEYAPLGSSDFAAIVTKIKQAKPDFIYSDLVGDSIVAFYKEYKQQGLKPEDCPIASIATDEMINKAMGNEYAAGHYTSMNYFETLETPENKAFVDAYYAKFKDGSTITTLTEAAYDSCYFLKAAIEKAGYPCSTEDLIAAFAGLEMDAPQGKIKVDEENHCTWLYSRFAKCNADGIFAVIYESESAIRPEPWPQVVYPELGGKLPAKPY